MLLYKTAQCDSGRNIHTIDPLLTDPFAQVLAKRRFFDLSVLVELGRVPRLKDREADQLPFLP